MYLHPDERISAAMSDIFYNVAVRQYDKSFPNFTGLAEDYAELLEKVSGYKVTSEALLEDFKERAE